MRRVAAVAGDAVRGSCNAAQLLDVQMQQIAWGGVLVTVGGRQRLQIANAVQLEPPQDAADGGPAQPGGEAMRQPAQRWRRRASTRPPDPAGWAAQPMRPAAAVREPGRAPAGESAEPTWRPSLRSRWRRLQPPPTCSALDHPLGHLFSTPNHGSCILVIVHLVS